VSDIDLFQIIRVGEESDYFANIGKVDINITNDSGSNLLHHALAFRKSSIALDLIRRGINVNHQNKEGQTALHYAAAKGNVEVAVAILAAKGDLSIKDKHGNTPLWTAAFNARGTYDLVKLFGRSGADPQAKNNTEQSPMDFAQKIGDQTLIQILLTTGEPEPAHELAALIRKRRSAGEIYVEFRPLDKSITATASTIRDLAKAVGLRPGMNIEVDAATALKILVFVLNRDLAYDTEIIPGQEAKQLAEQFLSLFTDSRHFYTNGKFNDDGDKMRLSEWIPCTDHTLDTGILVVCDKFFGCLWIADED